MDGLVANRDWFGAVLQEVDPVLGEMLFNECSGFSDIVVAIDGEHTVTRPDFREHRSEVFDCAGAAVDEVAGECDEIPLELGGSFGRLFEEAEASEGFAVEVGQLNDSQPVQIVREGCQRDGDLFDPEGAWFTEPRVRGGSGGGESHGCQEHSARQCGLHGGRMRSVFGYGKPHALRVEAVFAGGTGLMDAVNLDLAVGVGR